jgi:hypothetical protein
MTPDEIRRAHQIAKENASQDSKTSFTPEELKTLHKIAEQEANKHK